MARLGWQLRIQKRNSHLLLYLLKGERYVK